MCPERAASIFDVGKIRGTITQRRRHADHRNVKPRKIGSVIRRQISGLQRSGNGLVADIADEALAAGERCDAFGRDVESDDVKSDFDGTHRDGEPDVALTNDDDLGGSILEEFQK